ncbi:DUF4193 family protein [Arthrobacter sp. TMP15]|uniref:DUF4193 family protein n=1 Tax=Arthrobacter sp. TMP15 TaxID=3140789 RepID=UPI0031BBA9A9
MSSGYHRTRTAPTSSGVALASNVVGKQVPGVFKDALIDLADTERAEGYELPGGQLPLDELAVEILSEQVDEFTCGSCFLVRHRSQLVRETNSLGYCSDCEN